MMGLEKNTQLCSNKSFVYIGLTYSHLVLRNLSLRKSNTVMQKLKKKSSCFQINHSDWIIYICLRLLFVVLNLKVMIQWLTDFWCILMWMSNATLPIKIYRNLTTFHPLMARSRCKTSSWTHCVILTLKKHQNYITLNNTQPRTQCTWTLNMNVRFCQIQCVLCNKWLKRTIYIQRHLETKMNNFPAYMSPLYGTFWQNYK